MIWILTAPVQSGKTTSLINWAITRNDVHGILTPVMNGKRMFMNAETKEQFPMEAEGEKETLMVGQFVFSKKAFEKAADIIRDSINKEGWLIIDEIGPLELRGEGFDIVLKDLFKERSDNILLVVREGITKKVRDHYMINATEISSIREI